MQTNKLHLSKSKTPLPRRQPVEPASPEAWNAVFKDWLTAQASENTRQAYRSAWITFRKDTGAISSFYKFALRSGLCRTNPADPVPRPHHEPYSRARGLDSDQARALLTTIPRDTRQGKRDFALLATVLITGRPSTEICQLRFGDLQPCGEQVWLFWPDLEKPEHAPAILWRAIRDFLKANGQLGSIHKDDYLFTPLTDRATHLPNVPHQTWDSCQPLSPTMVGRLIKKYAQRAGLDAICITSQTLRYTADRLLRQLQVNAHPPLAETPSPPPT